MDASIVCEITQHPQAGIRRDRVFVAFSTTVAFTKINFPVTSVPSNKCPYLCPTYGIDFPVVTGY